MLDDLAATLLVQVIAFLFLHSFKITVNSINFASQCWQLQVLYNFANDALEKVCRKPNDLAICVILFMCSESKNLLF